MRLHRKKYILILLISLTTCTSSFAADGRSNDRRHSLVTRLNGEFNGQAEFGTCGARTQILGAVINPQLSDADSKAMEEKLLSLPIAGNAARLGFETVAIYNKYSAQDSYDYSDLSENGVVPPRPPNEYRRHCTVVMLDALGANLKVPDSMVDEAKADSSCSADGHFDYRTLADLFVKTTLVLKTNLEIAKLRSGSSWTSFDWREYRDAQEQLQDFSEAMGKTPEAHSDQFWLLVYKLGANYLGSFVGEPSGRSGYTDSVPSRNASVNLLLSKDLRELRPKIVGMPASRPPCVLANPGNHMESAR